MKVETFLRRLVVIRADMQDAVSACFLRMLGKVDRLFGRIRAGTGDDRDTSFGNIDSQLDDAFVLIVAQCR